MSISFLNSFPSFVPHVVAPSPSAGAPLAPPKLHVSATPLKPSTFAGEVFQARITFRCTPTTTTESSSTRASPATVTAAVPPPPVVTQPNSTRALTHQRAAHSMSVVGAGGGSIFPPSSSSTKRFHGGADAAERTRPGQGQSAIAISTGAALRAEGSSLPAAYSVSTSHLDKHSSENDIPPRRGLIGKGRITSSPLPTATATTPVGRRPGHSRQRSSSGSDLVNIIGVDGKHTGAFMDDEGVDSKGKRRAHRPEMGRAHSISGLPTWSSNQRCSSPSPADPDDDFTTSATAESRPNLPDRNTRPSIPASHPHARKPSYMPPSAFSSPPSASDPFGSGSRSTEDLHGGSGGRGGVRTTSSLASISEFQQGSEDSLHHRRPPGHFPGGTDSFESDNSGTASSNNGGGEGIALAASPVRYARAGGGRPPHSMHRPSYSIGLGRPAPGSNSSQTSPSSLSGADALRRSSATGESSSDPGAASEGLVITWSYAHLVATLTPSSQYLPPESLLPLRHALLQSSTIGSGTFTTSSTASSSISSPVIAQQSSATRASTAGGWFSLPPPPRHSRAPSLTSSLFGLARGVVWGAGGESSLEAERRRKWEASVKEVPVLETLRCVGPVGVMMGREGREETVDFIYTLPLPPTLPPTYQGRALKITYTLVVGVEVELPPLTGGTRERRSRELRVPVRVWGGVEGEQAATRRGYDLMRPVIQKTEEGTLKRVEGGAQDGEGKEGKKSREKGEGEDKEEEPAVLKPRPSTQASFKSYARHLLSTLPIVDRSSSPTSLPPAISPPAPSSSSSTPPSSHTDPFSSSAPKTHRHTRSQALSPGSYARALPKVLIEGEQPPFRAHDVAAQTSLGRRRQSFGKQGSGRPPASLGSLGEDDADGGAGGAQEPSEAVLENLLRSNQKASYDIEKEGQVVAVFTLTKSAYRLGETVSGVMTFNRGDTPRRVLKFSALLQTHELVPASLHPPAGTAPPLKPLIRTHADYHASMTHQISRLPFALDLPGGRSDTIGGGGALSSSFVLRAEADAEAGASTPSNSIVPGGVEWKVRLSFLASCPPKRSRDARVARSTSDRPPSHLVPRRRTTKDDVDEKARKQHTTYQPATSIAPVLPFVQRSAVLKEKEDDEGEDESFDAVGWLEMRTEVIECDVPIVVFPPSRLGLAATAVGTGTEELGGEMEL